MGKATCGKLAGDHFFDFDGRRVSRSEVFQLDENGNLVVRVNASLSWSQRLHSHSTQEGGLSRARLPEHGQELGFVGYLNSRTRLMASVNKVPVIFPTWPLRCFHFL